MLTSLMQKMSDPVWPGFPLYHWLVSNLARVRWVSWVLLSLALISAGDVVSEYHSGTAVVEFEDTKTVVVRAENASAFQRAIIFEVIQTLVLVVLALAFHAACKSVSHYDIFAPGEKFKSLDDEERP
jgi:hypothetical protein